ncbi:hypothetical protein STENM223S_06388 [Streptomyces tendae]
MPSPGAGGDTGDVPAGRYGRDLFPPEDPHESERIDAAALVHDPVTTHRLRELGVGPGMRCLEVGAGTGTVARWLLEEAGVEEVVALDRDSRALAAWELPGLRVLTADITDENLDPGRFDLVHARFVLMHLPGRRGLVHRLAGLLRPGGVLVLGDAVELPDTLDRSSPYRRTMDAMWAALWATIGTDLTEVPSVCRCPPRGGPARHRRGSGLPAPPPGRPGGPLLVGHLATHAPGTGGDGPGGRAGDRRGTGVPRVTAAGGGGSGDGDGVGPAGGLAVQPQVCEELVRGQCGDRRGPCGRWSSWR